MMKKVSMLLVSTILVCMLFTGCRKDESNTSQVAVRLKDAPADWDRVELQVTGVKLRGENKEWVTVPMPARNIDILTLRDTSMLLGVTRMPVGTITDVKLELGATNTITVGGITITLNIMLEDEGKLTVKVNEAVNAGGTTVLIIDLDAATSIFEDGHGGFRLKADIKCSSHHNRHGGDD